MSEHIGHQHIGILAVRHAHRIRHQLDDIQVRAEHLDSCVEEIDFEVFALLSCHLGEHQFVDQLEVSVLHDVDYPT